MQPLEYVLGVDAGNTKTIALVAHLDGTIAGAGRGGCGDIYGAVSADAALAEIDRAVTMALQAAGLRRESLAAGGFSLAGADWPDDYDFLRSAMEQRGYGRRIAIYNDAAGALWAGAPHGPAVVVVCGTGVAIGARNADGAFWHTSHWQEPHGSHQLSHKVLRAVCRAELGIDPPTSLAGPVLALFGKGSVEEVLYLFTARGATWPPGAGRLAGILLDQADAGDPTARRMVLEHGASLGDFTLVAARKVGVDGLPFALVLAGGVLRHPSPLLRDALVSRVRTSAPNAHVVASRFEPALGALLLAYEQAGVAVDDELLARLAATAPGLSFFAT